jgi:hypothetical protein
MFSNQTLSNLDALNLEFRRNVPFKHVYINNFLDNELAENLYDSFPQHKDFIGEGGTVGLSSIEFDYSKQSAAYSELMNAAHQPEYLRVLEKNFRDK